MDVGFICDSLCGFWWIENEGFFFFFQQRHGGLRMNGVWGGWFDLGFIFLGSCSCSCWRLFQIWIHVYFCFKFFFFISLKLIIQMLAFYNVNKKYFRQKHYADVAFFVVDSLWRDFFFFIKWLRGHFLILFYMPYKFQVCRQCTLLAI